MKYVVAIVVSLLSNMCLAQDASHFHFAAQSVYNEDITLNVVNNVFGDLDKITQKPTQFHTIVKFKQLQRTIKQQNIDLVLWGYSKSLDKFLQKNGFQPVASAPFEVNLYQYTLLRQDYRSPVKVAAITDSSALYTAKHYFSSINKPVEFVIFKDYFNMIQSCFRKEFDMIAAAPSFLLPQPVNIQERFKVVEKLPPISNATIWMKKPISVEKHEKYFKYFASKQAVLGKYVGTGDFVKIEQ